MIKDRKQGKWINYSIDDSDIFKRFLVLSVLERVSGSEVTEDKKKLDKFLKNKGTKAEVLEWTIPVPTKRSCCWK